MGVSPPDGFNDTCKAETLSALIDPQAWPPNVLPNDEQVYGHRSTKVLPMSQVKEARERDIRLLTEHGMFEIVLG